MARYCPRGHDKDVVGEYRLHGGCKQCNRESSNRGYRENHEMVIQIKLELGCTNCGYKDDPRLLEFHHVDPSTKLLTIAKAQTRGRKVLLDELASAICCANHVTKSIIIPLLKHA